MARLSKNSTWLIQQIGNEVVLFQEFTEIEIVRFDPGDGINTAKTTKDVYFNSRLTDEEKCMAIFWMGYFYHANAVNEGE